MLIGPSMNVKREEPLAKGIAGLLAMLAFFLVFSVVPGAQLSLGEGDICQICCTAEPALPQVLVQYLRPCQEQQRDLWVDGTLTRSAFTGTPQEGAKSQSPDPKASARSCWRDPHPAVCNARKNSKCVNEAQGVRIHHEMSMTLRAK